MSDHKGHRNRLREKYLKKGMDMLSDDQALELLLFYALPRIDTNPLARKLIAHFGSLTSVLEASVPELMEVEGIGETTAALISMITPLGRRYMLGRNDPGAQLTTTQACGEYLVPYFFGARTEMVYLLCLDAKCKVLLCKLLEEGTVNSASFSIRKAVEVAISSHASTVVLAHNHTSGMPEASQADYDCTYQLRKALEPLEISLSDHIIVTDGSFISLAELGVLDLDTGK